MKREREEEERRTEAGNARPAKRERAAPLDAGVVHVRTHGAARVYADYALRCVAAAAPGACVRIAGTGRAVARTVAVVELVKARFARAHAPRTLVQAAATLAPVPVGDHTAPRLEIVLCCSDDSSTPSSSSSSSSTVAEAENAAQK